MRTTDRVSVGGGGRVGAQGWPAVKAAAARSPWASPRQGPAIWSPTGRPSRVNPQGTVIAGTPHDGGAIGRQQPLDVARDRKSTRLNSSHTVISYAVFCLKKK